MAELTQTQKTSERVFGKKAGANTGKSPLEGDAGVSPQCPHCNSKKIWRDSIRHSVFGDKIQRWLCRECGLRFSDPDDIKNSWSGREKLARQIAPNDIKSAVNID